MSGGAVIAIALGGVVIATILALFLARNITVQVDPEADYAGLLPPPSAALWREGDETTLWLSTNRRAVDMRISSVSLGIGHIHRVFPGPGREPLARGEGCLDFAVVSLAATGVGATSVTVAGEVERAPGVGAVTVHIRARREGGDWGGHGTLALPAADTGFTHTLTTSPAGVWRVEASDTDRFNETSARRIRVDTTAGTATADEEAERLRLLEGMGVGVVACAEDDDVLVTLHGEGGAELNRYTVDIGPPPTATPTPAPILSPHAGYASRRVCVDDDASRAAYLDGGELVGGTFTSADFGGRLSGSVTSASLGDVAPGNGHVYHFGHSLSQGAVQLTVSGLGASGDQGLNTDRVYPVRLAVSDGAGATAFLDVGVWLDASEEAANGDGICS